MFAVRWLSRCRCWFHILLNELICIKCQQIQSTIASNHTSNRNMDNSTWFYSSGGQVSHSTVYNQQTEIISDTELIWSEQYSVYILNTFYNQQVTAQQSSSETALPCCRRRFEVHFKHSFFIFVKYLKIKYNLNRITNLYYNHLYY